ncbi:hypothetical protein D3C85_1907070 [compost metagenome]
MHPDLVQRNYCRMVLHLCEGFRPSERQLTYASPGGPACCKERIKRLLFEEVAQFWCFALGKQA